VRARDIEGTNNRLKISADAVIDQANNKNAELISSAFSVDTEKPLLTHVSVTGMNHQIQLHFNEPVFSFGGALNGLISLDRDTRDNLPAQPLTLADKVTVRGNIVTIALASPLRGSHQKVIIAEGAIKDTMNNLNALQSSLDFAVDHSGPIMNELVMNKDNRVLTVKFNEQIFNQFSGIDALKKLTDSISLTSDANTQSVLFETLKSEDRLLIKGNSITIVLAKPLHGQHLRLQIAAYALRDSLGNQNELLLSNIFAADDQKPELE
jgi:hypothetical protein